MLNQFFLYFIYFITGFISLTVQVILQRQIILVIGGTIYSISILLSSWMFGFSLGNLFISKFNNKIKNNFLFFLITQIIFLIYILIFNQFFFVIKDLFKILFNITKENSILLLFFKSIIIFMILLIPTTINGISFPLLSGIINKTKIANLYGFNTLGSFVGVIIGGFIFIPNLGYINSLNLIIFSGFIILLLFTILYKLKIIGFEDLNINLSNINTNLNNTTNFNITYLNILKISIPVLFLLSGFTSLSYELLYNRILIYFTGNNFFCFVIITSIFILSLAIGSFFYNIIIKFIDLKNKIILFGIIEIFIGLYNIFLPKYTIIINDFSIFLKNLLNNKIFSIYFQRFISTFIVLFPVIFCFGFLFPLVIDIYLNIKNEKTEKNVGTLSFLNSSGSFFGIIISGYIFINLFQVSGSLRIISLINIFIGIFVVIFFIIFNYKKNDKILGLGFTLSFILIIIGSLGGLPMELEIGKLGAKTKLNDEVIYYKEGVYGTVSVAKRTNGTLHLKINGVGEVPTDYNSIKVFKALAYIPYLLSKSNDSILTIAFGAGITFGTLQELPGIKKIKNIEICKDVLNAAEIFSQYNNKVYEKSKKSIIIDDGRNYIENSNNKYDIIISDSTHPIASDSWLLYTQEFYKACYEKLFNNGIFAQWVPIHQISLYDYKIILNTVKSVFKYCSLFFINEYTIIVGSDNLIDFNKEKFENIIKIETIKKELEKTNFFELNDFLIFEILNNKNFNDFIDIKLISKDQLSPLQFAEIRSLINDTRIQISEALYNYLIKLNKDQFIEQQKILLKNSIFYFKNDYINQLKFLYNEIENKDNICNELKYQYKKSKEFVSLKFCYPEIINQYLTNPDKEKLNEIEELLKILPTDNNLLLIKSIILYKMNRYEEALNSFFELHRTNKSPDTYKNIVIMLKKMNRYNDAKIFADEAKRVYGINID